MYRQIALLCALVFAGAAASYSPAASMAQEQFVLPQDRIGQSFGGLAVNISHPSAFPRINAIPQSVRRRGAKRCAGRAELLK